MRWILVGCVLALAGCGSGTVLPPTVAVTGTVYDGKGNPLKGGMVQFTHATDTTLSVSGRVGEDGNFTLKTVKDRGESPGAPAGEYRVTILPPLTTGQSGGEPIELPGSAKVADQPVRFELRPKQPPKAG